jgi:hypothetical protein
VLAGALVVAGCTRPPDDLVTVTPWQAPSAGLPATLAVMPGGDATFAPPAPPPARSGGEQAARSMAGVLVYPIVGGLYGLVGAGAPTAGAGAIIGVPVGMAVGLGAGVAEGARALGQDVHTQAEVEASVVTVRRLLDPTRLGDCLRDTVVARSAGRLVRAPTGASGAGLRIRVEAVTLSMQREAPIIGGANPPMVLSLAVAANLDGETGVAPGRWTWNAEPRRYFAATAEEGRILQSDIGLAVGMIAQRILVELYPGSGTPPPTRRGPEAEAFRTACPDVAPTAAAGQTAGAESVTSRR